MINLFCCLCGNSLNVAGKGDHCGKCSKKYLYAKKQLDTLGKRVQDDQTRKWAKQLRESIFVYNCQTGKRIEYRRLKEKVTN